MLKVASDSIFMEHGMYMSEIWWLLHNFRRGTIKIFRNSRVSGSDRIKKCPWVSQPRTGSHKSAVYSGYHGLHGECWHLCHQIRQVVRRSSQCVTRWWVENSELLKQTCTTIGGARKWVTTVTDVMILNYVVGLDVASDGTQCNTQGVWPCKLLIDSLPLQILAMSPDLMEDLRKQPRRCFP